MGVPIRMLSFMAFMAAVGPAVSAADADKAWPDRTVRIITGPAGSSPDAVARTLADAFTKRWKQTGDRGEPCWRRPYSRREGLPGSARRAHAACSHRTACSRSIRCCTATLPYDPERDFAPISLAVDDFLCVAAAPSLGVNSLNELVKLAAAKPGELNAYAVPGSPHLAWLAFQKRAGISTTFRSIQGTPRSAGRPFGGREFTSRSCRLQSVRGQAEAGRIKVLAVTNAVRAEAAPEIPTVAEAGYPDFTFGGLLGLFGPKDMPPALQERIASEVREALKDADVNKRLTNLGLRPRGTTPAEFRSVLDEQRAKWAAIARAHDIKPKRQ